MDQSLPAFQKDVLNLLAEFKVNSKEDIYRLPPGEKPYFLARLHKSFTKDENQTFKELRRTGSVEFHFDTSCDLGSDTPNLPNTTFLKKTACTHPSTFNR